VRLTAAALFLLLFASPCYASDAATTETYTVELERQEPRIASKVVARSDGTVALTLANGKVEFVQAAHVRSIRDQDGIDWTSSILSQGGSLGAGRDPRLSGQPEHYRSFRLRPGPPSVCGTYLITETGVLWPSSANADVYLLIEDGLARNIGGSHSVGAAFLLGLTSDLTHIGVRFRFAQWVSRDVSINLSPGVIVSGNTVAGDADLITPQFTAQVGLNLGGRAGLVVDMFRVHLRERGAIGLPNETRDTSWHFGIRLGAVPGLVTTLPALLVGARAQEGWD
jgi:hypothetical protein